MSEIFVLAPTAYEVTRAKLARQTEKQRLAAARRTLVRMCNARTAPAIWNKMTTGGQYEILSNIRSFCETEGLDTPHWVTLLILLHEAAQKEFEHGETNTDVQV